MSIVGDGPCPKCVDEGRDKTGNHLIEFEDGNKYCNRCGYTEINGEARIDEDEDLSIDTVEAVQQLPFFGIPHRQISVEACEEYGVRTEFNDQGEPVAWYFPHRVDGTITGYKRKTRDKRIFSIGDTKAGELFGPTSLPGGSFVTITEGEEDTLALWDTLRDRSTIAGWKPAVLSLAHGAPSAATDLARNAEVLDRYDRVVLCFDEDEAGRGAVDEVAPLFAGRVYVTKLARKDANEMVLEGLGDDLKWDVLKNAKRYQPDGIVNGSDTWERYKHSTNKECIQYPEGWDALNAKTYGFRPGELVTITSGTGVGKTQILRELKYHIWKRTDWGIADISLEEDVGDSVGGIMGLHMGRRIHLPDVEVDEAHERAVHEELFGSGRWEFYDHFGGMDDSNLFNKIRYFAVSGCRAIFLDHLSIVVSEYAAEGGERERIDTVMTKLAKICKELEVTIFVVVHLRKEGSGKSFEQGAVPSLDDLRGSGSLKQLSWDVLALSRDQQHPDAICRNVSKITVLKCRFSGNTGTADYLKFDTVTGRMLAVPEPAGYEREEETNTGRKLKG